MALIIIGALFILTGFRTLTQITEPGSLPVMLVCFAVGGILVYFGYKRIKNPPPKKEPTPEQMTASMPIAAQVPDAPPVGTFTFEPTGSRFDCKFPKGLLQSRQGVLNRSKVGDPISFQVYEWNGERAVAVMNDRLGVDLGVVKKGPQLRKVLDNLLTYDAHGKILKFTYFEVKNEEYKGCEIQMEFYER